MLEALYFMSIKERIKYNVCQFKMVNNMCPIYLCKKLKFVQKVGAINTRQIGNLCIDGFKTNIAQKMLFYNGFKMYNEYNEIKKEQSTKLQKVVSAIRQK